MCRIVTTINRIGLLAELSWREVSAPSERYANLVVYFTSTLAIAFVAMVIALLYGAESVVEYRKQSNPFPWRLQLTADGGGSINSEFVSELRVKLDKLLGPSPNGYWGIFPSQRVELELPSIPTSVILKGRTVERGEWSPLSTQVRLGESHDKAENWSDSRVIIVQEKAIRDCREISRSEVDPTSGVFTTVQGLKIRYIGTAELPDGMQFLVAEEHDRNVIKPNLDCERSENIKSLKIPETWKPKSAAIRAWLQEKQTPIGSSVRITIAEIDGEVAFRLSTTGNGAKFKPEQWRKQLENLHKKICTEFQLPEWTDITDLSANVSARSSQYWFAWLYLKGDNNLEEVIRECRSVGLTTSDQTARRISGLMQLQRVAVRILPVFGSVLVLVAGVNLVLIQQLRLSRKCAETGVLKSMGMTGAELCLVYALEGAFLGLFAAIAGIAIAWCGGTAIATSLYSGSSEELERGFQFTPPLVATLLSGSTFLISVGMVLGAMAHWSNPASESLQRH